MKGTKKRIGILGGISAASTLQYYKGITDLYFEREGDYYYPEILINSLDFQLFTDFEDQNRMEEYIAYIKEGIGRLKLAGADFVAMAANSPHSVFPQLAADKTLPPLVSIMEAVAMEARRRKMKKLLLTGIRYTMDRTFYQEALAAHGLEVSVPSLPERRLINEIIFGELAVGKFTEESRRAFRAVVEAYPVDGVILGCTELPLLLKQEHTEMPLLDSLDLHCRAILREALS